MTFLEAAYHVLAAARGPLHYAEIAQRAIDQHLIASDGTTPDATMGSRLYTVTKDERSEFVRVGKGFFDLARRRPGGIDAEIEAINDKTRQRLRALISSMPPRTFETLIKELLLQMGFDEQTVRVTRYHADGGIDVVGVYTAAGLTPANVAIQAKRWRSNVQAPVITGLRGSLQANQQGVVITASDFSAGARAEAEAPGKTRIGLIAGDQLIKLLIRHQVGVIDRTLAVSTVDEEWWSNLIGVPGATDAQAEPQAIVEQPPPAPPPTPAARRVIAYTLFGEQRASRSWKGMLMEVVSALAERHPGNFEAVATSLRGRTRQHIAPAPDGMIAPEPVPGTGLWLETNQSAVSSVRLCNKLIAAFGHPPGAFEAPAFEP